MITAVLLIAALTAIIASLLLTRSVQEQKLAARAQASDTAFALAEAGLDQAIQALNNGWLTSAHGWSDATDGTAKLRSTTSGLPVFPGEGSIRVRIDDPTGTNPQITALGLVALPNQANVIRQLRVGAQQGERTPGRHARGGAFLQQLFGQCGVALAHEGRDQRMVAVVALHEHRAGMLAATGAPRHLGQQLPHALAAAKIRAHQAVVGAEDHCERHAGEMVPLGQHLGAHEDAGSALVEPVEQFIQGVFAPG